MKIVISTSGASSDAPVDPRFGRAENFLVYDTETESFRVVPNIQNVNAAQGAGIQAGQHVASTGASVVITGNCGPKAFRVLDAAGVKVFLYTNGTVKQALDDYLAGKLEEAASANVEGHWM